MKTINKITNTILTIMTLALMSTTMRVLYKIAVEEVHDLVSGVGFAFIVTFMMFLIYALCVVIFGLWTSKKYK